MKERRTIFDYLNNIYSKNLGIPEEADIRGFVWPINRMLSMEKDLLDTISYLTKYISALGAKYYLLLFRVVPKSLPQKHKYLKVDKMENNELVNRYTQYFKLNKKETSDYLQILFQRYSKEEIYSFVGLEVK